MYQAARDDPELRQEVVLSDRFGHVAVVASLGYIERVRALGTVTAVGLVPEPYNRYNPNAIAVQVRGGHKIGYLAPEAARVVYGVVTARYGEGKNIEYEARRISVDGLAQLGVFLTVDLSGFAREAG